MTDKSKIVRRGRPAQIKNGMREVITNAMTYTYHVDRKTRMYAGDAGFCSRLGILNGLHQGEETSNAAGALYMGIGSAIHKAITDGLADKQKLLFAEYKLPDIGLNLGGYIDAIVYAEDHIQILEIKSCGALPSVIKAGHRSQASVYSIVTGLPAQVIYVSRSVASYVGDVYIRAIPLNSTVEILQDVLFNVVYSHLSMRENTLGPVPSHLTEPDCGYCRFKQICWHGGSIPESLTLATDDKHIELLKEAKEIVKQLTHPDEIKMRRNGVLKYLSENGSDAAKKLLTGTDWEPLLRSI